MQDAFVFVYILSQLTVFNVNEIFQKYRDQAN